MTQLRVKQAAEFLGASEDTVRRLIDSGALPSHTDEAGRIVVPGAALASHLRQHAAYALEDPGRPGSARNRFLGLVTAVRKDSVMAQVDLQCGPFRVVSLLSAEAVEEMGLEPGSVATAVVKATNVVVEAG
ncbi:MAG: TOBE domain-containing protein [Actinobacteria bacterium]|nr:TOBE domain-containing protein [Actinomycetota bacterium]